MRSLLPFVVLAGLLAALAPAQDSESDGELRFTFADVVLDSGAARLAAWQVELVDPSGRARVAGVEGLGAFADSPPAYDPAALRGGRIVLAAFTLDRGAPAGRAPVARVHVAVSGAAPAPFSARVVAAADPDGEPIGASIEAITGE